MVDRYTKTVLTVIAVALTIIAARELTPSASAQVGGPVHVIIDSVSPFAFQHAGPLAVRVSP